MTDKQEEPPPIDPELVFRFSTIDLTFEEVEALAQFSPLIERQQGWSAWAGVYKVFRARLTTDNDKQRLARVRWRDFPKIWTQFVQSLEEADRLRKLERQMDEISDDKPGD